LSSISTGMLTVISRSGERSTSRTPWSRPSTSAAALKFASAFRRGLNSISVAVAAGWDAVAWDMVGMRDGPGRCRGERAMRLRATYSSFGPAPGEPPSLGLAPDPPWRASSAVPSASAGVQEQAELDFRAARGSNPPMTRAAPTDRLRHLVLRAPNWVGDLVMATPLLEAAVGEA